MNTRIFVYNESQSLDQFVKSETSEDLRASIRIGEYDSQSLNYFRHYDI